MPGGKAPDTLASVIMLLCASRMVREFESCGGGEGPVNEKDLVDAIEGRYYSFGKKIRDGDGKERIMVDFVEVGNGDGKIVARGCSEGRILGSEVRHGEARVVEKIA